MRRRPDNETTYCLLVAFLMLLGVALAVVVLGRLGG